MNTEDSIKRGVKLFNELKINSMKESRLYEILNSNDESGMDFGVSREDAIESMKQAVNESMQEIVREANHLNRNSTEKFPVISLYTLEMIIDNLRIK